MLETQGKLTWIDKDVAVMGRPSDLRKAVELFKDASIGVVISLTETALNTDILAEFDIEYHHIPVNDFHAPDAAQIDRFVSIVAAAREARRKTLVHCFAGRGRSGVMAACYLISLGRTPEEALAEVRSRRRGAVETEEQEDAVHDYAKRLQHKRGHRGHAG
jgi:atypical dual specificity phosphatase